jgi:hypothetical protein
MSGVVAFGEFYTRWCFSLLEFGLAVCNRLICDVPLSFPWFLCGSLGSDGPPMTINLVLLFGGRFIYSFLGVGILLCCITLIGCIAAEVIHGCCLFFVSYIYEILIVFFRFFSLCWLRNKSLLLLWTKLFLIFELDIVRNVSFWSILLVELNASLVCASNPISFGFSFNLLKMLVYYPHNCTHTTRSSSGGIHCNWS